MSTLLIDLNYPSLIIILNFYKTIRINRIKLKKRVRLGKIHLKFFNISISTNKMFFYFVKYYVKYFSTRYF